MAIGDIGRLQFFTHANQRQFINTLHYREVEEETDAFPMQVLADAWSALFVPGLQALYSDQFTFGCVKANEIVSGPVRSNPGVTYYENLFGTKSSRALPGNTPARMNFFGTKFSRVIRGGMNISGLSQGDEEGNGPNAATVAQIETLWRDKLLQNVAAAGPATGEWEFGFMSRAAIVAGDPLEAWPGEFVPVDGITVSPFFSTLRSRQGTYTNIRTRLL